MLLWTLLSNPMAALMTKEFNIDKFKVTDDGYTLTVYIANMDKFKNSYYSHISTFNYKDNPSNPKTANNYVNLLGYETNNEVGILLKHLLEENEHLKFYNKVDKELK